MPHFAELPTPPYYVVCFSSTRAGNDDGYGLMADAMESLAKAQPGFLGVESARGTDGFGITNSYWETEQSIRDWKQQVDHLAARMHGRKHWYMEYKVRVAWVERAYGFDRGDI